MGVEPTDGGVTRRPPVLKTGTITGTHALPSLVVILSEARDLCMSSNTWVLRFAQDDIFFSRTDVCDKHENLHF